MTCRDCKYFDVANHKAYCRKRGDYLIPDGYSCPNFESKYQMTTTRNPYNDVVDYCKADIAALTQWFGNNRKEYNKMFNINMFNRDKVKKVIFNPPATIVYWGDGTKTVVKAQNGDGFDREKGFAMACAKKFFGNQGNYYNMFREQDAIGGVEFVETDETIQLIPSEIAEELHSDLIEKLGKIVRSGIEDGISYNGNGSVSMSPNKMREMAGVQPKRTVRGNTEKSDYIIEKIKEFTRDFWMLKVYSELDTEEWVLDIGVMNDDKGKSIRYIMNLEDVEWERIDEVIGCVTSSIANELIPSVWKKESD